MCRYCNTDRNTTIVIIVVIVEEGVEGIIMLTYDTLRSGETKGRTRSECHTQLSNLGCAKFGSTNNNNTNKETATRRSNTRNSANNSLIIIITTGIILVECDASTTIFVCS